MNYPAEDSDRVQEFKRNKSLEKLLTNLNLSLDAAELNALSRLSSTKDYPLIFVMGPLRSGSTLFMQWLANTGLVAYPTNLLSRFYGAPVIGAQIQLMLTDPRYNFRNEILDFNSPIFYESDNGKTKGALAPNEFWYFWRRFLPFKELDWLPDDDLYNIVNKKLLVSELSSLTRLFAKPFALKGMILNYNISFLDAIFKKALFIQLKRDPVENVSSILDARKRQLGSENAWYSFKIPEYPELKGLDPITQSAGQLHHINMAVDKGIEKVEEPRKLIIHYEEFCKNPRYIYENLLSKLNIEKDDVEYRGQENFKVSRVTDVSKAKLIEKAISKFDIERYP